MLDMVCVLCCKKKIPLCKLDNLSLQSLHLRPKPPKNFTFSYSDYNFLALLSYHFVPYSRPPLSSVW